MSSVSYPQYDATGNVVESIQTIGGQSYLMRYQHYGSGRLGAENYPQDIGGTIAYDYDNAGRVSYAGPVSTPSLVSPLSLTYTPSGAPQTMVQINGVTRTYSYNARLQLQEVTDVDTVRSYGCGTTTQCQNPAIKKWDLDLQFFWGQKQDQASGNNGNLWGQLIQTCNGTNLATAANFQQTYVYDVLNRLTGIQDTGGNSARTFNYDAFGNMWSPQNSGFPSNTAMPMASSAVNLANNRLTGSSYDAAGNQLDIPKFCTACLQYDAENRLTAYTETGTTYAYDGLGHRVQKTANGVTTTYLYDVFGQVVTEYSSGTAAGLPCNPCYVSTDHLGSTRMVTDTYGNLVSRHDYLPFGEEIPGGYAGRPATPFGNSDQIDEKFTGQIRDQESNLDDFNARYFASVLGRFTSPDPGSAGANPADPQTWNGYAYVRNSPLNAVDPSGRHIVDCDWDGCSPFGARGGGGGGAIIDGIQQTVFNDSGLGSNGLTACPGACSGFGTNLEGQTSYLQFTASAGLGPQGYRSIPEIGTYNYDIGNGQYLNAGQFNQAIQSAANAQKVAFASAVASQTGLDFNTVYNALQMQQNADGTTMVNGGNVQFDITDPNILAAVQALLAAGQSNRSAGAPSIHLHGTNFAGPYHLDTMSPYSGFGWGLLVHFGVDVFAGTAFYGAIPIPRP